MPIETLMNSDMTKALVSVITGGAFVGWYREKRRAKKDAQGFALEFMREQSGRIDNLVREVAELKADYRVAEDALQLAREEVHNLRGELFKARLDVEHRDNEIIRLKTALGEHNDRRGAA